jgi:hypothetical protein
VLIVIGPYGTREVKADMKAGGTMRFEWSTDGEAVEFDFHGDPKNPTSPEAPPSYELGKSADGKGSFSAKFDGHHGWAWKNLTAKPVVITATVKGNIASFAPIYAEGESAETYANVASASASTSTDTTDYYTDLPMQLFMRDVMDHAAYTIWNKQGYISDADGVRSLFPKNDEDWKQAENDSLSLAEMTNLLLIPGRRVEEQAWTDGVVAVRKASLNLAKVARTKDEDAYLEAGVVLNDACYSCHTRYAPGVN